MRHQPVTTQSPERAGEHARPWHALAADEALAALGASPNGLDQPGAARRLARHGPNRLPEMRRRGPLRRLLAQFNNVLIYVLLGAAVMSVAIGHLTDAAVILAVVLVNAGVGFVQEGRAEEALSAIRAMISPEAQVLRGGRPLTVPAAEVVPGDIVLLDAGDRVPADLRLVEAHSLRCDEAALTGESVPVDKDTAAVAVDAPLGDRASVAFSGTFVTAGQGRGVVVATGTATELGRISGMIGGIADLRTPLLRQMDHFARQVTTAVLVASALVFAYAVLVGPYALAEAFMVVVGLAVAAIPEGLPAVMTITLAVGVERMARRRAIIRRLPAVETLGAVSVICTDKTGTLTRNEMTVRSVVTAGAEVEAKGTGYRPDGALHAAGGSGDGVHDPSDAPSDAPSDDPVVAELALAALLCNDAALVPRDGEWTVEGDPMEGALIALAMKAGHDPEAAREAHPRIAAVPFDTSLRYMATLHAREGEAPAVYVKGAPEAVLEMCAAEATAEGERPLDAARWHARTEALAAEGQRVLALARRAAMPAGSDSLAPRDVEQGLTLLGLVGLIDPPRAEAIDAVAECRAAGIRVCMITGDHAATAQAIARQLGLAEEPEVLTGAELDALDEDEFRERARRAVVFARTSPEHKLRLVEALQADGLIVAMTGDGVNDAPALKRADVGVAMGGKGTEAAKEAAEIVLADDNFASIVAAVREGRTVYDNLTKMIAFTLPTSGGDALTIMLAVLFGLTLPVTPLQILWVNMVTAVALGLTLAFEPTEPGTMRRPPRRADRPLLSGRLAWRIVFVSVLMAAGAFGIYFWATARGLPLETARTMVVNVLVVLEIFYLFSVRYVHGTSLTWQGVLGTRAVLIGVAGVVVAQLAFTYLGLFQAVFATRPLAPGDGLAVVGIGIALLLIVEAEKRLAARLGLADGR